MFINLAALKECAKEGAIAVQLCSQSETAPDYNLGISATSNYTCTPVEGYAYVDRYSQIAAIGSTPNQSAWYVCLFPPTPTIRSSDRFLIEGKHYQIEQVQPIYNQGVLLMTKYHCLKKY